MNSRVLSVLLLLTLTACYNVVSSPDTFQIASSAAKHLRAPQTVKLVNGYSAPSAVATCNGQVTWDQQQLTETAIAMLGRPLRENSIAVAPSADKVVVLRVRVTHVFGGLKGFVPVQGGVIFLDARFGDGSATSIKSENRSPGGYARTFEGALLFAVQALLEDPPFVSYLNSAGPAPGAVSPAAREETSPSTTNCIR